MSTSIRLDKLLSHALGITRRESHRLIRGKRVAVNESVANRSGQVVQDTDTVRLDGKTISTSMEPVYLMLHKPIGYVCSHVEDGHASALSLVEAFQRDRLHFAGRLDADTTGLVLLTDDGQWSHRITAPGRQCSKRYLVELAEPLRAGSLAELERGVMLNGASRPTRPARITELDAQANQYRAEVTEGQYHLIKRLFGAAGNRVTRLHREAIGGLELDPALAPGDWRMLTAEEVALFA